MARPDTSVPRLRASLVLAANLAGLGLSWAAERVHRELHANAAYTSFCNINSTVNCDVVLTSPWAYFQGYSVSLLGILFYALTTGLALGVFFHPQARWRRRLADGLLVLAAFGLAFSLYMAVIAFAILRSVCLLCSGLYLLAVLNFLAAWFLRQSLLPPYARSDARRQSADRWVWTSAAVFLVVLVLAVTWELTRGVTGVGADRVAADPRFTSWFQAQPIVDVPTDGRNTRGSASAPVTIVEFSDFECSHCNQFHRVLDEVWRRYPRRIRVVFRHFPLNSKCNPSVGSEFHSLACQAAVAAECAGQQGKFWEYHDVLFANQRQLRPQILRELAQDLRLDLAQFDACLASREALSQVEEDTRLGARLGVNSTPTLFINGRMIRGALGAVELQRALALAESSALSH